MNKLSTAVLLLVEPLMCSRKLNLTEVFLVLLAPYFDLYLSAVALILRWSKTPYK